MKVLTFIICSNGYGHCIRTLKVLNEIFKNALPIKYNIICNKAKVNFLKQEIHQDKFDLQFHTQLMENEPNWLDPQSLDFSSYLAWSEGFKTDQIIAESDLIISDNYVAPLDAARDTLLMGSFLWMDIIEQYNSETKQIVTFQKELLKRKKPQIIALETMQMDSLSTQAEVFGVPWFSERKAIENSSGQNKILVTSGGTEHLDKVFLDFIERLANKHENKIIFLDAKLYRKLDNTIKTVNKNIKAFEFTEMSFKALDVIICRPGIGILTDCISFLIPPIVIYGSDNKEILHNAKKIIAKNLGVGFEIKKKSLTLEQWKEIDFFLDANEKHQLIQQNMLKEKMNGHQLAANKILNQLLK